jgi:hypothetical protein
MTLTVRFDPHWSYHGFRALVLENSRLRLVILPELGGKLWSLVDKEGDREIFWQNPRTPPRPAPYGAAYDDWFCGGWDELFPNDAPTSVAGDPYPDHGEWWAMPFAWDVTHGSRGEVTVHLHRAGVVTNTHIERRITLAAGEPCFAIDYRLHNAGLQPLDFLWKLHPALAITPDMRIDLPPSRVEPEASFNARLHAAAFDWPLGRSTAHHTLDLRRVPPPEAATYDFYYATGLAGGWCALTDTRTANGFGLAFDPQVFRSVWVFGAYGGWRGHYVTILEPCTGYPYQLETAIAGGTATRLAPRATLETSVTAVLYRGKQEVSEITRAGEVR